MEEELGRLSDASRNWEDVLGCVLTPFANSFPGPLSPHVVNSSPAFCGLPFCTRCARHLGDSNVLHGTPAQIRHGSPAAGLPHVPHPLHPPWC